jgi:low molecular weight protein-tyrosine phosphatase
MTVGVLFVCTGNICRSPAAEGVFRAAVEAAGLTDALAIGSAGIGAWHVGEPPDRRMQAAARQRGIELAGQRARQLKDADFTRFDLLLAMDRGHLDDMARRCPPDAAHRVRLFLDLVPAFGLKDVPDPYYGGPRGFEDVLDLVEAGAAALLEEIRRDFL